MKKKKETVKKAMPKKQSVKKATPKKTTASKPAKKVTKPAPKKTAKAPSQKKAFKHADAKSPKKTSGNKAKKKPVPIGRTIKTKDKYLPYNPKKVKELKDKRWVAVIDKNTNEELAIVRLTDEEQPNTTLLSTYKKGNKKDTYFKHFVETEDNEGKAIRVDGKKFIENLPRYDLSNDEVKTIQNKVYHKVKQSQANNNKIKKLKGKKKK